MSVTNEQLKGLLNPNLPYKSRKGRGGQSFDYITMRQAQMLLDVVCGPANWTCEFRDVGSRLFCRIGINVEGQWVYKEDCGSDSNIEAEKGGVSDAFKRAAVHWGIGRFLYPEVTDSIKGMWREQNKPKPQANPGAIKYDAGDKPAKPAVSPPEVKPVKPTVNKDWITARGDMEFNFNACYEQDIIDLDLLEQLCEKATGLPYVEEEHEDKVTIEQIGKLNGVLKYLLKHGASAVPKIIEQYKLEVTE